MREHHRRIVDWLRDQGATDVVVEQHSRHPRLTFRWQGALHGRPVPGHTIDVGVCRSLVRELSDLMGIPRPRARRSTSALHRARPSRRRGVAAPPLLTVGRDWQAPLARLLADLVVERLLAA